MSVNRVTLVGRLGQDPELRDAGGSSVCSLSIATDESYTNSDGERVEQTEWHDVSVWGAQAEACAQYLSKGRQVYVSGSLQTNQYTDGDGIERYSTEIRASRVQFLDGGEQGGGSPSMQRQDPSQGTPQTQQAGGQQSGGGGDTFEPEDSDQLPF